MFQSKLTCQNIFDSMWSFKYLVQPGRYAKFKHLLKTVKQNIQLVLNRALVMNFNKIKVIPPQLFEKGSDVDLHHQHD